ncbi:peptidoglycan/xylan/chitin deacetylase (PgdA/CDA1 family) [Arthrobacter sp. PvP023]|uniref:polysaccharide deacetylase family protein n=1 Tax=Micrococcaceae TaxID=1268 RepID=UPI001AE835E4|nr:polysaccharide deacetylase family protein [Arthrobacter sp. PvP023]MBP1137098.1 peptidoglycan/xylan/chitin deacetylase (PgdA/CDA1 family) [Arthrobacter sp. PvP023]
MKTESPQRFVNRRGRWAARTVTILSAIAMAAAGLAGLAAPANAAGPTVVSLTFDDGNADQLTAAGLLNSYGMKGTFFVPSGFVNNPGYMSVADLQGLQAAGHEIGGHSVTHPDLTTLPADEATRQVCNDRVNLTNWNLRVTSFAYPFAAENATAQSIVRDCGYNSARGLGDIKTRFSCSGCALAENIPPANPYVTAAPDQVDTSWRLADLQTSVTQAEPAGGWVQLTFHHVAASSTDPLNITPTVLNQFLAWLKARPATTTVKTVDQVIGGTVKPAVSGPAVPPQPSSGNLVKNSSVETLVSNAPQCWQQGGYGTNTPAFSIVTPGHTGTRAAQLRVTKYVNGDAKWLPSLDLGGCSPTATAGHTYNLGAWYKSTTNTQFALYYRTGLGSWVYWTSSPWFAPATTFQKASWTTPPLPTGASGISFGLNLFSNGTLITDDYELIDTATAPPPPPPAAGTNLVQNPGLETAGSGGFPQCWQAGGFGSNTPRFTTVSTGARSGTKAEELNITNYVSGDAKLLPSMDAGSCSPPAIAGKTYSLRAWYRSTAVTQFAIYYRNSSGAWVYWTSGPWLPASATYTQASFTTAALPAGATAISFGLSLFSNGTLTTDDYAMYDTVGAPAL